MTLHDLLASNRRRKKIRTWIGLATIIPALIAVVLVVKLLSMYVFAHQSIRTFVALDFGRSVAMATWQGPLNFFEPYKADYNLGTGFAELGRLDEARTALERALPRAPLMESCAVRYNLATVVERQGDDATANGEADLGQDLYREALDILGAAHEGCFDELANEHSPDTNRSMPESISELARRIMEKLQQSEPPPPQPEPQQPDESQLERLKQQLEDGAEERQERDQGRPDGPGMTTDRPW